MKQDSDNLNTQIEQLENEKSQYESENQNLKAVLQQDSDNLKAQIEQLETEKSQYVTENQSIKAVLQEKTRQSSQMKTENVRLLQSVADMKSLVENADMAKETIQNLSKVIRDKDLEMEGLKSRNDSLVTLVQTNANSNNSKSVTDNTNEIIVLKNKISDLEQKLAQTPNITDNENNEKSEISLELEEKTHDLKMAEKNIQTLKEMLEDKNLDTENQQQEKLQNIIVVKDLQDTLKSVTKERDDLQVQISSRDQQLSDLRREVNNVIDKKKRLEQELERLKQHLMEVEEGYTKEALEAEEKASQLQKKLDVSS